MRAVRRNFRVENALQLRRSKIQTDSPEGTIRYLQLIDSIGRPAKKCNSPLHDSVLRRPRPFLVQHLFAEPERLEVILVLGSKGAFLVKAIHILN